MADWLDEYIPSNEQSEQSVKPDVQASTDWLSEYIPDDAPLKRSMAIVEAQGVTPDQAAEARALSKKVGVPAEAIEPNLDAVRKQQEDKLIMERIRKDKAVYNFMSDPNFAKIGKDDVDGLTMVADRFRALAGGGVISPIGSSLSGAGEAWNIVGRAMERPIAAAARSVGVGEYYDAINSVKMPWWLDPAQILSRPGQNIEKVGQAVDVPAERRIDYVDDVISGAGQVATQIATMLLTGGAGMMAMAGTQAIDTQADRARKAGTYGTASSDTGAILAAPVTAVMEKFGLDKIIERAPLPIRNAVMRNIADVFAAGGIEAAQEVVEGVIQNVITQQFVNPDQQILEGMDTDAAGGFGGGAVGRALILAATRGRAVRDRSKAAQETDEKQEAFNQVVEATNASKVNLRDKEAFRAFVDSALPEGADPDLYIPAEKLEEYFQSVGFTPEQFGISQSEMDSAIASDGDITIPKSRYFADIAPEHHASLADFIRLTETSMTAEEARTYADSIEEIATEEQQRVMAEMESQRGSREGYERVQVDLMQQLKAAGFSDDVAQQYAAVNASLYATAADRLGGDAFERYQADAPRIVREIQGRELGKRIGNLEMQVADAREYFKRKDAQSRRSVGQKVADMFGAQKAKKEKAHPRPMLRYLESLGGVDPNGKLAAELKAMDITPKNTPRLFRVGGIGSLDTIPTSEFDDAMRDYDVVAPTDDVIDGYGYVPEGFLLDMIRDEAAGNYLRSGAERAREQQVAVYEELRDVLGRADLDLETASIEEIRAALGAYQDSFQTNYDGVLEPKSGDIYVVENAINQDNPVEVKLMGDEERGWSIDIPHLETIADITNMIKAGYSFEKAISQALTGTFDEKNVSKKHQESFRDPDGVTYNQDGSVKTDSEAFKKWFGDSKVVDADGKPLVVYHGTDQDFEYFEGVSWFTDSKEGASGYSEVMTPNAVSNNPNVMPVYIRMKKPKYVDHFLLRQDVEKIRAAGKHDGIIVRNVGTSDKQYFVTFRPEQIKSIHNRGTFDPNDARILYQGGVPDVPEGHVRLYRGLEKKFRIDYDLSSTDAPQGYSTWTDNPKLAREYAGSKGYVYYIDLPKTELGNELVDQDGERPLFVDNEKPAGLRGISGKEYLLNTYHDAYDANAIKEFPDVYNQGQQEGPRGSYTPSENLIKLFETANLSTFLHESGHMWLERMKGWAAEAEARLEGAADLDAEQVGKLQEVIDDYQKILKHIGNDGSGDLTREQHEEFARTVEAYLMDGKAPSVELQPAFERFKTWLLRIYETVKNLRVNMNPEIRGVLDRMLATSEQIAEAERIAQYEYLDIPDATPEERMRLNRLQEAATGEADRALLQKTLEPIKRQKEKWWKDEFRAMSDTVRAEIESRPEWRALRLAQGDENIDPVKLDLKALEDKFGSGIRSLLPRGVTTKQGGANPDEMAELVGLLDAQELVELLGGIKGVSINTLVRQEAQARMDAKYGDVLNDGTIEKEAADAVRNNKRADHIALELKTLRRLGAEKEARKVAERRVMREGAFDPQSYASEAAVAETGAERLIAQETQRAARFIRSVDRAGRAEMERAMSDINPKAIRNAARKVVGHLKNKDLTKTAQYARGELKAADLARKAIAKRDYEQAAFYKYRQLLNHYLYIEAKAAQKELDTAVKYLGGLAGKRTIPAMDQEYLDQIHGLLEKFDFRRASQAEVERRRSFAEWAAEQEALGRDIVAPDSLIEKSQTTHYSQVTLDDIRGLKDTVKQIDGLGRLKQKLLDGQQEREYQEVVTEAVDSIYDNNERIAQMVNQNPEMGDKFVSWMRSADASLLKMEQIFDWLDGGKQGVFTRVFKRFSDAQARENDLTVKYNKGLNEIFDTLDANRMQDKIRIAGYLNKDGVPVEFRRSDLMAVVLNLGNQHNLDRLMDRNGNNLTEANIKEITTHLNKTELEAVNKTWELIDTLWPEIEAMEKRVNKVAPPKVEATPFDIQLPDGSVVNMRGGYYPIIYDPLRSTKASQHAEQDAGKRFFEGNYVKASTIKNHTKERRENVGRPIQLKMELVSRHLGQVIHDLTHREAIIETDRLLSDKRIQEAVNNVLGREYAKTFRGWLHSIAGDRNIDPNSLEGWAWAASRLRTNITVMSMGFRFTTMISQVAGFSAGAEMIGAKWVGVGMKEFYRNPAMISTILEEVRAKSGEMRHRHNNLDRDLRDGIRKLERNSTVSDIQRLAFSGIGIMDAGVSAPIWIGAYQKALSEKMSDADAVAYADKAVRLSQSAGGAKDLSEIQRGSGKEFLKLFTMFYSYFNAMYARQRDMGRSFKKDGDFNEMFLRSLYLLVIPSIGTQLLTGRGPGEEEEPFTWAILNLLSYPFASIPFVRDVMSSMESGYGYSMTPVARGGESVLKLGKSVGKSVIGLVTGDEVDAQRLIGNTLDVTGAGYGLPTGQLKTTGNYIWDLIDGDQRPDGVLEVMRGLTLGPEKK